jgi:ParB family chromosome partitioning protein
VEKGLEELAESIKLHGVVQPLLLQKNGTRFTIIAGERRWRAARLAGLKKIPAVIKEYSKQQVVEVALIENIQREDLNPIEEAAAYNSLMKEYGLTQEEAAVRVGKSRSAVANSLRLLALPEQIMKMVSEQVISAGHARALLGLSDAKLQLQVADTIVKRGLSVRETEQLIAMMKAPQKKKKVAKQLTPELAELETTMKRFFGTKVKINGTVNRGKIEIEYCTRDDIERILEIVSE